MEGNRRNDKPCRGAARDAVGQSHLPLLRPLHCSPRAAADPPPSGRGGGAGVARLPGGAQSGGPRLQRGGDRCPRRGGRGGCRALLCRRPAGRRRHRRLAGQRSGSGDLLGRHRPHRPGGGARPRPDRHQHTGRADRRHRRHRPASAAGGGAPCLGGRADDPRQRLDRLDPDPADGHPCRGQAAGHRRHGPHRTGGGRPRPRLRHDHPLQQPPPPAPGAGAWRHLPRRSRGDVAGVRCAVASLPGDGGNPTLAERRPDRAAAAGRHPDQHRARQRGGRHGRDRRAEAGAPRGGWARRVRERAEPASRLPRPAQHLPAAASGQRHGGDAERHGLQGPGQCRRGDGRPSGTRPGGVREGWSLSPAPAGISCPERSGWAEDAGQVGKRLHPHPNDPPAQSAGNA
ncbi:hypothetical protein Lal_00005275 [Lupinus albus]|nr:hypothetical protein Lal_00005275 [Lupinus albus]